MQRSNYDHVGRNFGAAVASARASLGLSQRALAAQLAADGLQIDASGLSRLESGTRTPRLDEAVALANALGEHLGSMVSSGISLGAQVKRGVERLESMREQLIDLMEEYNRLRLELAFAADDLLINPHEASTDAGSPENTALQQRVMQLMHDGPVDVALRYELNHGDAPPLDDPRPSTEVAAALATRDRAQGPDESEPHTGAYLASTLYRGSDNTPSDRRRTESATEV